MGKNYTIYVKYQEFANEENKSGLFNKLYGEHLRKISEKVADLRMVGIDSTVRHESTTRSIKSTVIPNKRDVTRFKKRVKDMGIKLCQHDFPPTTCKYAKPGKPCK
jgi:hypothetical protein